MPSRGPGSSRSAMPASGSSTRLLLRGRCGSSVASHMRQSTFVFWLTAGPGRDRVSLTSVPLVFVLIGLTFYIVLAGADFGAAVWQVSTSGTREGRQIRDFAHNVMAPVWEANHVWLIFVLT